MRVIIQRGESFVGYEVWPERGLPFYIETVPMHKLLKEANIKPLVGKEILNADLAVRRWALTTRVEVSVKERNNG